MSSFSHGGRDLCKSCDVYCSARSCTNLYSHQTSPVNADWSKHATCKWACKPGFFGSKCELCATYRTRLGSSKPNNSHWVDGVESCEWACDKHYPLNEIGDGCDLPTAPGAPDAVVALNASSGSVYLSWSDPPRDQRIQLLSFRLLIYRADNLNTIESVVVPSSEVDQFISYSNQTVRWGSLYDVLAETTYRFSVQRPQL